jgi:hypothetical protein
MIKVLLFNLDLSLSVMVSCNHEPEYQFFYDLSRKKTGLKGPVFLAQIYLEICSFFII